MTAPAYEPPPRSAQMPRSGPRPEPFGPDSLLWRYFGNRLGYMVAPAFGILQNMYPALGAGVVEHSDVWQQPWARLTRSLPQILGVVFDGPAAPDAAARIRRYHESITGIDTFGHPYHALDPDTFFWAHATFVQAIYVSADLLGPALTKSQRHQLYDESIDWYAMYGLSMRPVPPDYDAFQEYWRHTCEHVLQATPAALRLLELIDNLPDYAYPGVPRPLWAVIATLGRHPFRWLQHGVMPAPARARLGISWTSTDGHLLRALTASIGTLWPYLPARIRLISRAYAARQRERQRRDGKKP